MTAIAERVKRFFKKADDPEIAEAISALPIFKEVVSGLEKAERAEIVAKQKELAALDIQERSLNDGPLRADARRAEAALADELREAPKRLARLREEAFQAQSRVADAFGAIVQRRRELRSFLYAHQSPQLTAFAERLNVLREKLLRMPDRADEEYRQGMALVDAFTDLVAWRRDACEQLSVVMREASDLAFVDMTETEFKTKLNKMWNSLLRQLSVATGTRRRRPNGNPIGIDWQDEGTRTISTASWLP